MSLNELFITYEPFVCGTIGGFLYELVAYYQLLKASVNYEEEEYEMIKKRHRDNLKIYFIAPMLVGGIAVFFISLQTSQIWQLIVGFSALNLFVKIQSN